MVFEQIEVITESLYSELKVMRTIRIKLINKKEIAISSTSKKKKTSEKYNA